MQKGTGGVMGEHEIFKTTIMGGFDKEDVLEQVQRMKDEAAAEQLRLKKLISEKDAKIAELMKRIELKDAHQERLEMEIHEKYQKYIADWLGEHFFLYNNEYGNDYLAVIEQFEKQVEEKKLDLLILDNLMAFNISGLSDNKYDAQTAFVLGLEQLAKRKDIHILFVAHPRKAMGFLRLDDISGTGDLGNAVDNAFIVHRVNEDFRRLTKQMFGWKDDNELYRATNVIEIAKDRDGGIQDYFIPLFYEKESKRLKNYVAENKLYGWNKHDDGFVPVSDDMELVFE